MAAERSPSDRPVPRGRGTHRVLMTADTVGGVWQFALELCRELSRYGDRIALATMGAMVSPEQRRDADAIPGVELHASHYRLAWMDEPWDDIDAAGTWLRELAADFQPDVVHLNDYSHAALPWGAPVLVTGHSDVLSWWHAVHGQAPPREWDRYAQCVRRGLRSADLVAAPTRAMLAALEQHYGSLPRARVIANGRRPVAFGDDKQSSLVFAAGRIWDEAKNLGALAAVAPHLRWPVVIAGEDRHPDGSRRDLPNVRLLGRLGDAELAPWFARAPVYAMPARYEPFGLSVLEAALAGCALVLGDLPSLREVWGEAALYVDPDDHDALRETLRQLIADAPLRRRQAAAAQARAARYTPAAMARAYRRAYADLGLAAAPLRRAQPRALDAVADVRTGGQS